MVMRIFCNDIEYALYGSEKDASVRLFVVNITYEAEFPL